MKKINGLISLIEEKYGVKVLFAVESGSRAWGISSKDSDYDVRFVFYRPIEEYLKINPSKDVINVAYDKDLKECPVEGSFVDFHGHDVIKFTKLLSASNPTAIEWLCSTILYFGTKPLGFVKFAREQFDPKNLYYHYKSLCRNNYLKYIKPQNQRTYKKYLYCMRGVVNALYVKENGILPPMDFNQTLREISSEAMIPDDVLNVLYDCIEAKKESLEKDEVLGLEVLDEFIEAELQKDDAPDKRHYHLPDYFNKIIWDIIKPKDL